MMKASVNYNQWRFEIGWVTIRDGLSDDVIVPPSFLIVSCKNCQIWVDIKFLGFEILQFLQLTINYFPLTSISDVGANRTIIL